MFRENNKVVAWYKYIYQPEKELIDTYVNNVEEHVNSIISNYQGNVRTETIEFDDTGQHYRSIDIHNGLDSESWDLDTVFIEYFPNLIRRSAVVTLVAYFENSMLLLSEQYQNEMQLTSGIRDSNENGIMKAVEYLETVGKIGVHKESLQWDQIHKIVRLRNCIVHGDGKVDETTGKGKDLRLYIRQQANLDYTQQISIGEGYLAYVVETFYSYLELLIPNDE